MEEMSIKVMVVDDHRIFRDGIISMFEHDNGIEIIGLASNGREALEKLMVMSPDVILLDLTMPVMGGIDLLKSMQGQASGPETLVMSMHADLAYVTEVIASGAKGYVCKADIDRHELQEAIISVSRGETYFGRSIRLLMEQQFITGITSSETPGHLEPGLEVLSKREREMLKMVMEGMSNQEIAESTFVSIRTVETHKNNIMIKLNMKNTVELVKYAIRHHFFDL
jgi:DNA-binding NarL/FixJ family response regulator